LSLSGQELDFNCGSEDNPFVIELDEGVTLSTDTHILINNLSNTSNESYVRLRGNGILSETKNAEEYLRIGANGTGKGTLVVEGGATLSTVSAFNIGYNACTGELVLEEGAKMTGGQVYLGKTSKGGLTVKKGAYLYSSADLTIARNALNASANAEDWTEVNIEGGAVSSDKFWMIYEGANRKARMTITDGGSYTNRANGINIGRGTSGTVELTVDGEGSAFWNNGGELYIANGGSTKADIAVKNGARFHSGSNINVAHAANSEVSVLVATNSTFETTTDGRIRLANGDSSKAAMSVDANSTVSAKYYVQLAVKSGSEASLEIGGGSTVKITDGGSHGRLEMGEGANSTSTLTINDGGLFQTAEYTRLAIGTGSTSTINLNEGGVLATKYFTVGSGTAATINMDGGTIRALSSSETFLPSGVSVKVGEKGAIIDTNGNDVKIPAECFKLADGVTAGTITKIGGGTLTLTGTLANGLSLKIDGGALADNTDVRRLRGSRGRRDPLFFRRRSGQFLG